MAITLNLPPEVEATLTAQARALGLPLNAYVQRLVQEQAAELAVPRTRGSAGKSTERELSELQWLELNRQRYAGQWVALEGDALLAAGNSAREVYAAIAGREGTPLVTRIEPEEQVPFAG